MRDGASDVHFEPKEAGLLVRFRLDGEMRDHANVPLAQRDALLARGRSSGAWTSRRSGCPRMAERSFPRVVGVFICA
jgi:hypothetical protein